MRLEDSETYYSVHKIRKSGAPSLSLSMSSLSETEEIESGMAPSMVDEVGRESNR